MDYVGLCKVLLINLFFFVSYLVRSDQTTSDPVTTPSDDVESKATDLSESSADAVDALPNEETPGKRFEEAGVYVTDNDIVVSVSSSTGLRKTGFSDNLYVDDGSTRRSLSKIPRSPMARRRSVDSGTVTTGLPLISRKGPVYRSVRKQSPTVATGSSAAPSEAIPAVSAVTITPKESNVGTWSGRSLSKKRPSLGNEIFQTSGNIAKNSSNISGKTNFQRNSDTRASYNTYDQNGRRIKSTNTSPTKQNVSPLAQQILEAAENAKNDAQMLEKMKLLLSKYTNKDKANGGLPTATSAKVYEDFTTAWVNSNGSLDRVSNCCSPSKMHSKRSSAASSIDSTQSRGDTVIPSHRRERGVSRIPGPIRQNTELY